jgi:uncharacterized protein (TIGR00297 family)
MLYIRICAAKGFGGILFSGGRLRLRRATQFSAADLMAMAAAAVLVAVYSLRHVRTPSGTSIPAALVISASFALLAWLADGVNWSGALAGCGVAFILVATDVRVFWELFLVFAITFAATKTGKRRKQELRVAESSGGRSASQVMANLGAAGMIVAIAPRSWPWLALAALAEAAADTASSEIGMAFPGKTVLLTSWKPVAPGIDGGVSLTGTTAAIVSAAIVSTFAVLMKLVTPQHAVAVVLAGVVGSLVDSMLGALLERRGFLNNDLVNLLSTASATAMMAAIT